MNNVNKEIAALEIKRLRDHQGNMLSIIYDKNESLERKEKAKIALREVNLEIEGLGNYAAS